MNDSQTINFLVICLLVTQGINLATFFKQRKTIEILKSTIERLQR